MIINKTSSDLNKFFGKTGSQTSIQYKKDYGNQISETIKKSLIGESNTKAGLFSINQAEFDIYSGLNKREIAEKRIIEINTILNSPVGYYLSEHVRIVLSATMNCIKGDLKKLENEYDDYYSMERGTFLSQTKLVPVLEETIKVLSGDNGKNKDLSARLVAIAKKRLSEISKTQE